METPDEEVLRTAPPATLDVPVFRALDQSVEVRADRAEGESEGLGTMVGHFSVFDSWYEINSWFEGHFLERLAPGAFKRTIKNRSGETPIRVLLEHGFDPQVGDKPLGVPSVLEERDGGAYAETPLLDTSYNRDLAPALAAGAYGQSFRFQVLRDEWDEEPAASEHNPKGIPERTIKEVRLVEFGPTVFPASPATNGSTGLRSTTDHFLEQMKRRDPAAFEDALARSRSLRLPQTPAATVAPGQPEDPQTRHSEDPPADVARHSEDSPQTHSEQAPHASTSPERSSTMEQMTIEERAARQSEIRARLAEIDTEFAGSELNEEARTEFDALSNEYDAHQRAVEDTQRRQERIRALADNPAATEQVRPSAQAPAVHTQRADIYDLGAIRQQARSVDDLPRLYRDNAMRAVEGARFPGVEDRSAAQAQVERLLDTVDDEHGTLARRILTTGSPAYDRAFGKAMRSKNTNGLNAEELRALSLGVDADGGYAVPFQLDPTVILTSDGVIDPLRSMSRVEQIVGKEWQGVTSAGVTVSRSAEGVEVGENSPTLEQPTVKATRVTGFVPFSMELESSWQALRSEITAILADAKATEEASAFLTGNGTGSNPEGLLTALGAEAGSLVAVAAANTYAVGDLYALEDALPPRHRARAQFLTSKSIYQKTRQFDSNGGANLWVRLGQGNAPELLGYPAREASEMPTALNVDTSIVAVFGDFAKFLIVDRVGMSVELVPHLIGANRRPTGQRGVLAVWHNGCKALDTNAFRGLTGNDGV
jgi:HK97 family phage major capsid protein/HK97 family phage prohead protease